MTKVTVRDYAKTDGTHVKRHTRNDPRAGGSSEELNPEDKYEVEATVTGEMDSKGKLEDTKVTEVKLKPKEKTGD
ncbi:MAG: hypothetical protein LVQ63_07025 [Thermoplasmatales archaeon]|nr:hypothetical protein [Thermoplasmatales archaeon]